MTQAFKKQNQTLDCLKLFAACLIVCAHVGFPEPLGALVNCLFRFAVPMFFAISGYFSFGARGQKIARRLAHAVKLNILAIVSIIAWNCLYALMTNHAAIDVLRSELPDWRTIANFIFLHINPVYGHLWYLMALAAVYAALWIYVAFFGDDEIDYRPLYLLSAALLFIRYAAGDLPRKAGIDLPYYYFRDGWFTGLPMFAMGLFIRQYHDRLVKNYRLTTPRLLLVLVAGIALSLLQIETFGTMELPAGAIVQAFALILLALRYPRADFGRAWLAKRLSSFGFISTAVYILQFCVYDAYALFLASPVRALLDWRERWVRPLLVAALAVAVGAALYGVQAGIRRMLRRGK